MFYKLVYEGKSKRMYVKNLNELLMEFKDEVTAGDGAVKASATGKGYLCAATSAHLFKVIEDAGIRTHLIEYDGFRTLTVRKLKMVPIEVIVRNFSYGSLLKRMPLYKELEPLVPPLVEFHYKDDSLHDPLVLAEDILRTGTLSARDLSRVVELSLLVNHTLGRYFRSAGLKLVDIKLEFGFDQSGDLVLADEISGDTFRALDEQGRHLDKEVFRRTKSVDALLKAYRDLALRLGLKVVESGTSA
ncbi:MAG: phosphoribosylaminoimidazolesuccinocarboxamide synthase [Sulfolobales archaeon]|nr:phosphoribosylaminoimidazolesuccinocarboxamide synthase [Sulfolobales archaeon]MCX8208992.1 phosphoribosylaminoimidazolesuccinocarboxamide synthase [Sulfolobales archaeon]